MDIAIKFSKFSLQFYHTSDVLTRVLNWPTNSGPNPKTNLKPKSCPKKPEVTSEKFSYVTKLILFIFCAPTIKSTSQARIKPAILDPKGPARLTTPLWF